MNSTTGSAEDYLKAVRKQLADLPSEQVADILADISPQILETAVESDRPLAERFGPPQRYAEELRTAAGLQASPSSGPGAARFALWSLAVGSAIAVGGGFINMWVMRTGPRTLDGVARFPLAAGLLLLLISALTAYRLGPSINAAMMLPEIRGIRALVEHVPVRLRVYLRSLQPGWWLGRGLLIAAPALLANQPGARWVVTLIVLAAVAVWVGPKARTDRRWLWISVPAAGFALGTALLLVNVFWANTFATFDGTFHFVNRDWPTGLVE